MSETLSVASRLEHHDSVPTSAAPVDPCGGDVGGVRRRVSRLTSTVAPLDVDLEWSVSRRARARAALSSVRGTAFT